MTHPSLRRAEIEARVGELLAGRFRLERVLGAGGMGWVYLAIQEPLGRRVAVKVLARQLRTGDFEQRFFREASVASRLSSPHIVTVHDYGATEDGELFIAMEYAEGMPLNMILRREKTFTPERICDLVGQVCRGLSVAHDAGVVHRDLKPSNIILMRDRQGAEFVKILDFGLVKTLSDDALDGELTGAEVLGSPNYMAPEQIRRTPVDARTDVYGTGVLIYRLLTGHLPFEAPTPVETMTKHLKEAPPSLDTYVPDADFTQRQLEAVALRCLEKRPDERYASMDDLAEALEAVERFMRQGALTQPRRNSSIDLTPVSAAPLAAPIDDLRTPVLTTTPSDSGSVSAVVARPPRRSATSLVLGGLVLVALSAVVTLAVFGRHDSEPPQPSTQAELPPPALPEAPPSQAHPAVKEVQVHLASSPAGATVRQGDRVLGVTPADVRLAPSQEPVELVFELAGHLAETRQVRLEGEEVSVEATLEARPKRVRRVERAPAEPPPASPVKGKLKANPYD